MTNVYKKEAIKFAIELLWIGFLSVTYAMLHRFFGLTDYTYDFLIIPGLLIMDDLLLRKRRSVFLDRLLSGKNTKVGA